MDEQRDRRQRDSFGPDALSDQRGHASRNVRDRSPKARSSGDEHFRRMRDEDQPRRRRDRSASEDRMAQHHRRAKEDKVRNNRRPRDQRRGRSVSDSSDASQPSRRKRRYSDRSRSRDYAGSHQRRRSRSPVTNDRRSLGKSTSPAQRKDRAPLPSQAESFTGQLPAGEKPVEKQKPNFKPTGLLAKEANTVLGTTTVLKYHEPPEARKPSSKDQWRLYVFKKKDLLDTVYLHERSVWLMGRDQKVTDLLLEHPSISKQHAVIQFRHITTTNEYGDRGSKVKPYLIDLESANGTKLNGKKIDASRYVELVDQDVVSFGDSEREYVMMLPPAGK